MQTHFIETCILLNLSMVSKKAYHNVQFGLDHLVQITQINGNEKTVTLNTGPAFPGRIL